MSEVKTGDSVRIHYKGTLLDGSVFDCSEGRDPLEFEVGSGMIIPGLDVSTDEVMLDANHPLAGRDLTFDTEVVGIGKA